MALALQAERLKCGANLDAAAPQDPQHRAQRDRVLGGPGGDDVGVRPFPPAADGMGLDIEEVGQPALALASRMDEQRVGAFRLIRDDLALRTADAAAGTRESAVPLAVVVAAGARRQPV